MIHRLGRRDFLARMTGAGLGVAAASALPRVVRAAVAPQPEPSLIERSDRPEQWETSLASHDGTRLTYNELFFVRSHFGAPSIDVANWRLEVSGKVNTPLTLSLEELMAMQRRTEIAVRGFEGPAVAPEDVDLPIHVET